MQILVLILYHRFFLRLFFFFFSVVVDNICDGISVFYYFLFVVRLDLTFLDWLLRLCFCST